jgi:hypothetical protein
LVSLFFKITNTLNKRLIIMKKRRKKPLKNTPGFLEKTNEIIEKNRHTLFGQPVFFIFSLVSLHSASALAKEVTTALTLSGH